MTNNIEWINSINLLAILYLVLQYYKFQTDSIVQALLVDDILNLVLLTCLDTFSQSVILRNNMDRIPTLSYRLLP